MKEFLRSKLTFKNFYALKRAYLNIIATPFVFNLNKLATIYKCDKWGRHFYTKHYQYYFKKYKFRKIKLFEIGVGGYHYPHAGGTSLRMWKRYFPFARIFSLDIYDKSFLQEPRIRIFQGSQTDELVLSKIIDEMGAPDIIIDDGSHINDHVITSFKFLFPHLKSGGIYAIEDTQTSYWPDYGGDSNNLNNPLTIHNFFKSIVDNHYCPVINQR